MWGFIVFCFSHTFPFSNSRGTSVVFNMQFSSETTQRYCRPHRLGARSHKTAPISDASGSEEQVWLLYFRPTSCKFGVSTTPSSVKNLLEQPKELGKALSLLLPIYFKGDKSGTAKWKRRIGQSMGEQAQSSPSLRVPSFPAPWCIHHLEAFQTSSFRDFDGGFITSA